MAKHKFCYKCARNSPAAIIKEFDPHGEEICTHNIYVDSEQRAKELNVAIEKLWLRFLPFHPLKKAAKKAGK